MPLADTISTLVAIAVAIGFGVMSPGPSFIMVGRTAVASGRAAGVAAAVGMGLGGALFALAALLGLHLVFAAAPMVYRVLQITGALYLLYLGYRIWFAASSPFVVASLAVPGNQPSLLRAFLLGLTTQVSNPKTAVVYASVFSAALPAAYDAVLGTTIVAVMFMIEFGWYALVAVSFSAERSRSAYLAYKTLVDRAAATAMCALGAKLLFDLARQRLDILSAH